MTFDPEISEWGNPSDLSDIFGLDPNLHTQGSETSKYLEENKTILH